MNQGSITGGRISASANCSNVMDILPFLKGYATKRRSMMGIERQIDTAIYFIGIDSWK